MKHKIFYNISELFVRNGPEIQIPVKLRIENLFSPSPCGSSWLSPLAFWIFLTTKCLTDQSHSRTNMSRASHFGEGGGIEE